MSPWVLYYRFIKTVVGAVGRPEGLEGFSRMLAAFRRIASGRSSALYSGHLSRLLPVSRSEEIPGIIRSYWQTHERNIVSLFLLAESPVDTILDRVEWKGRSVLDSALEEGRGILLMVPHYGDERGLHVLMGMAGYDVDVMTSRYSDMPEYCREARLAPGKRWNTLHYPDESPRWMIETLRGGGIVHYAPTAYGGPGGTWIESFGIPVLVPSAPWKLHRSTGCTVLSARCSHRKAMSWEIGFERMETPDDRIGFASAAGRMVETLALSDPGQYEWKNLAIRHRETNTIRRIGKVPADERELEVLAVPEDNDPAVILPEAACSVP